MYYEICYEMDKYLFCIGDLNAVDRFSKLDSSCKVNGIAIADHRSVEVDGRVWLVLREPVRSVTLWKRNRVELCYAYRDDESVTLPIGFLKGRRKQYPDFYRYYRVVREQHPSAVDVINVQKIVRVKGCVDGWSGTEGYERFWDGDSEGNKKWLSDNGAIRSLMNFCEMHINLSYNDRGAVGFSFSDLLGALFFYIRVGTTWGNLRCVDDVSREILRGADYSFGKSARKFYISPGVYGGFPVVVGDCEFGKLFIEGFDAVSAYTEEELRAYKCWLCRVSINEDRIVGMDSEVWQLWEYFWELIESAMVRIGDILRY